MATVADLIPQIFARLEEPNPAAPVFWDIDQANFAAIESLNDALLLVGRPTQIVSVPFDIVPNQTFQQVPPGMFAITNIQGAGSEAYKVTLEDFDYLQCYGGSDWTQDMDEIIGQWCPIGLTMFAVHPTLTVFQTVLLTGLAYPCTQTWPYDNTTITIPFADQFLQAFEKYAAHYLRFLESGDEFTESYKIYQSYLSEMQRMTEIETRMDPFIFNKGIGVPIEANPTTMR